MALVVLGPLVQGLSGQLGGTVFHGGKKANVISRAPCRVAACSKVQADRRAAFQRVAKWWRIMDVDVKVAWERYAAAHPQPNALSVLRNIGGFQMFVQWGLSTDPNGYVAPSFSYPPSGPACQAPVVESVDFHVGGPYNLTVENAPPAGAWIYMFCTRWIGKMGRSGPGGSKYMGPPPAYQGVHDWYGLFAAKYFELAAGEKVRLHFYWCVPLGWASSRVELLTTVV